MKNKKQAIRTTCPYCGVGCGVLVNTDSEQDTDVGTEFDVGTSDDVEFQINGKQTIEISGDPWHPANRGQLCGKGRTLAQTLSHSSRLASPKISNKTVSWNQAIQQAATAIQQSVAQYGADSVGFYVSGQLLTEDYYVANKLMKGFIGSANIDSNSRLCMSSPALAQKVAFGSDSVVVNYEDIEAANLVLIVGSNLAHCHPVLHQRLRASKKTNPEKKIIVIDPRRTATCEIADIHLPIKSGGDLILFSQLFYWLSKKLDAAELANVTHTVEGFEHTAKLAAKNSLPFDELAKLLDLDKEKLRKFFESFLREKKVVSIFSQGVNQSTRGTDQCSAIINCHLILGKIGYPGAGPLPVTGQPNAMGGREVGALATSLVGHANFDDVNDRQIIQSCWQTDNLARKPGLTAVEMFNAVARGDIRVIWIMATNPVVTLPNSHWIKQALEKCPTVIVSEAFAGSETIDYANILLPAAPWGEKSGTVTNSERCVSRQRAFMPAFGQARPDWKIICDVAKAMGYSTQFDFDEPFEIFNEHKALLNRLCANGRALDWRGLSSLTPEQYQQLSPWQWPQKNAGEIKLDACRPFADGKYDTDSGKARLKPIDCADVIRRLQALRLQALRLQADIDCSQADKKADQIATSRSEVTLTLNSGRLRDQWHTMTRTGLVATLNQNEPEPVALLHPRLMNQLSLRNGDLIEILASDAAIIAESNAKNEIDDRGQIRSVYICREDINVRLDQIFIAMHWDGKNFSEGSVNSLIPAQLDPLSKQPAFKQGQVRVKALNSRCFVSAVSSIKPDVMSCDYWSQYRMDGEAGYRAVCLFNNDALTIDLHQIARQLFFPRRSSADLSNLSWLENHGSDSCDQSLQIFNGETLIAELELQKNKPLIVADKSASRSNSRQFQPRQFQVPAKLYSLKPSRVVCSCAGITTDEVESKLGVASELELLLKSCGAGQGCGSCIGDVALMLEAHHSKRNDPDARITVNVQP